MKIWEKGNYIKVIKEDGTQVRDSKSDVRIGQSEKDGVHFTISSPMIGVHDLIVGNITDENDAQFTEQGFEDFADEHTGNFSSPSGSSGGVDSVNGYTGEVVLKTIFLDSNTTITKNGRYGIDTSNGEIDIVIDDNTVSTVFLFDSHKKWDDNSCNVSFLVEGDTFELDKKQKEYEFSFNGVSLNWFEYGKKVK